MPASLNAQGTNPSFTVNDLSLSLRFYTDGLGFEIVDKQEADGKLTFVSLSAGDARLGIIQDDFAKGKNRVKGVGVRLWLNTKQDIAALAKRVKAAGFALEVEPGPLPWGPMAFAVSDPDGYKITVANVGAN
jgi:catechol 2,3-dioxygenase-like lactoylglutathione lyase family enzyme